MVSHKNSSSYLMKVSVLIYKNQYQFWPIFLRYGLWRNLNLDHYTENWVLWLPNPCLSGTKEHSYLLGHSFAQLPRYFMYILNKT